MSKYEQLRRSFSEYANAEKKYVDENQRLTQLIVNGLRDYLEMPKSYEKPKGSFTEFKSYTPFYKMDEFGNTSEVPLFIDAISHLTDGTFNFAFGVILEKEDGKFPKRNIIFKVYCTRRGDNVEVDISGKSVELSFDGNQCPDIHKAHDVIFNHITDFLKRRPGDGQAPSKFGYAVI